MLPGAMTRLNKYIWGKNHISLAKDTWYHLFDDADWTAFVL